MMFQMWLGDLLDLNDGVVHTHTFYVAYECGVL